MNSYKARLSAAAAVGALATVAAVAVSVWPATASATPTTVAASPTVSEPAWCVSDPPTVAAGQSPEPACPSPYVSPAGSPSSWSPRPAPTPWRSPGFTAQTTTAPFPVSDRCVVVEPWHAVPVLGHARTIQLWRCAVAPTWRVLERGPR
jgi:hypothetical protein